MALTKSDLTFQSSATNTAGSTTTGSSVDCTDAYEVLVQIKITNGGTGPTVPCYCSIEVSFDNSTWNEFTRVTAGVANSGVYRFPVLLPASVQHVRTVFSGNTGQSVTVEALGSKITAL